MICYQMRRFYIISRVNMQKQIALQKVYFILLINTKSGGGWGRCYLQLKKQQFSFQYKKQKLITVKLIDLFDKEKKQRELKEARQLQRDKQNDIRVIVCGGDGTIVWGIEECLEAGLNSQQLLFACLPIGTGNDFSRTIGWGSDPLKIGQGDILPLKKRIIEWVNATISDYDIWQVEISVCQKGQIYTVKNKQDFLLDRKQYKVGFVNYLGVGIDGRVTYNFQKNRKSTKLMNLAVYCFFGCFLCCKKIPQLSAVLQSFEQEYLGPTTVQSPVMMRKGNLDNQLVEHLTQNQHFRSSKKITLKKGTHGVVCLNSISYMAGAMNAWHTKRIGCTEKKVNFQDQSFNDGKIQFVGYKNQIILGFEKFLNTGARVAQGQGPFHIRFKDDSLSQFNYVQIDGEALKLKGVKQIVIRKHQKIPSGRIRIMVGKR